MKSIMNKGLLFVLLVLISVPALFAKSYSEYLAEAKKYEEQKRWCYALGSYYDAMEAVQGLEAKEALDAWEKLRKTIEDGKPGYGEFDEFDFVDNWILLLQEYEQYWTENSPKVVYFNKPERIELNRENRTANYRMRIELYDSPKFKEIDKIIQSGFKKAYKDDWSIEYLKDWPEVSVYNDKKHGDNQFINGAALTTIKFGYNENPLVRLRNGIFYASDELVKKSWEMGKITWEGILVMHKNR